MFIAFGSLFAMALPLVAAVVALASGILTVGLLTHVIAIPVIGPTLAALIGLGVGIDYALFVVTRHRNGIKAGMTPEEACIRSLNTSGRAVLFAGTTVCIALLGLLVLNLGFLNGLGISAAVTVLFTMAPAVTLLPALLGFIGMRVLSRERRRLSGEGPAKEGTVGLWARWAAFVARHPRPLAILRHGGDADPCDPVPLAPPRPLGRGQRPVVDDDAQGLRPARRRASDRASTARCSSSRQARRRQRRRWPS